MNFHRFTERMQARAATGTAIHLSREKCLAGGTKPADHIGEKFGPIEVDHTLAQLVQKGLDMSQLDLSDMEQRVIAFEADEIIFKK